MFPKKKKKSLFSSFCRVKLYAYNMAAAAPVGNTLTPFGAKKARLCIASFALFPLRLLKLSASPVVAGLLCYYIPT